MVLAIMVLNISFIFNVQCNAFLVSSEFDIFIMKWFPICYFYCFLDGINEAQFARRLWGDIYFNRKT